MENEFCKITTCPHWRSGSYLQCQNLYINVCVLCPLYAFCDNGTCEFAIKHTQLMFNTVPKECDVYVDD
jgi:hypothetical protein